MSKISNSKSLSYNLPLKIAVFTLLFTVVASKSFATERTYTISIIPMYSHEITLKYYSPFIEYIKKETGKKWELKFYNTHNDFIVGFCKKEIDIAFTGPIPFIVTQQRCKANMLLTALGNNGKPYYNSAIFTAKKNLKNLRDLNGMRFGYVKGSTLAHIVPLMMLEKEGVKVNLVRYKRQEEIVKAVLSGEIDAGGVKKSVIDIFKEYNINIILISEDIPNFLFYAQLNLQDDIRNSFINALIRLKPLQDKNHKMITEKWSDEARYGFLLPNDEYLQKIKQLSEWHQRFSIK